MTEKEFDLVNVQSKLSIVLDLIKQVRGDNILKELGKTKRELCGKSLSMVFNEIASVRKEIRSSLGAY